MILSLLFHLVFTGGAVWGNIPPWPPVTSPSQEMAMATAWMPFLADLGSPQPGTFEPWLINAAAAVGLVGALFWLWNQAKEALGRKPDVSEEVEDLKQSMVTKDALETRLTGWASEIERKFEKALHDEFKQLNGERSRSIGNLHDKVETTADGLRAEINEVRTLVAEMPSRVVELLRHGRRS